MSKEIDLDIGKISYVLSKRLPEFLPPWSVRKTLHGQSNPTFILTGKNKNLVLRTKPKGKLLKSAHMIDREYKVMRSLYNTEVPVPKVYYLCDEVSEIGNIYFIMDFIDGHTFEEPHLPDLQYDQRAVIYDSMNLGLSRLHNLNPFDLGLSDFGKQGNYYSRQLSIWSRQYNQSCTESIIEMDELRYWLLKNIPDEILKPKIVHGDWRIDNLIFSKKNFDLIGIIDWELATLGDPRADLASQIMQWSMPFGSEGRGLSGIDRKDLGIPSDEEYVDLYSQRTGLSQSPDLEFPIAFCYFRMGAILQGVKKRAIDGIASNPIKGIKLGNYVSVLAKTALKRLKV